MHRRILVVLAVLAAVFLVSVGCASPRVKDINKRIASIQTVSKKPPNATYVVDPPDSIHIEFLNETSLSRGAQLRQDGVVTLPHVGETDLAGMTTKQIEQKLVELYRKYYDAPAFVVKVTDYRSKHFYVYGEVRNEGQKPYTGSQTLSDAIGAAGGLTKFAAEGRVKVIRGDPEEPEVYRADLGELIYDGDTRQEVSLAENDVVYVPPTWLAWVGYQIDQLLFPFRGVLSLMGTARSVSASD